MRKVIPNRTQMAGKLLRMVHILLMKMLRRNAIFVMKLMIILQQLVQEEQKLFSISPPRSLLKWHQRKVSRAWKKRILFSMFIPWSITEYRQTRWWEMPERLHLQKCITWQRSNEKPCSGMSWAQRNYRKWTVSCRVQEQLHYEAS